MSGANRPDRGRFSKLHISVSTAPEDSFDADEEVFVKDNMAITRTGISMKNNPKVFQVVYEELEIGDNIGRGSSSVVVRALHRPTRTPVALKIINMFDKSKRSQLIREICTLYDAQCPSLISFYGAFYREGAITIALEYMDGGSLSNVLAQAGPIPELPLANMAFQILWGLAYLHHEKRVHRDIKPSNILINSSGQVKITDFGISAELANSIAMCGTFVGTFKYMSPERIQNLPYSYSSDLWSFGLVVHECATGEYPYVLEATPIDMAQMILESPQPSLPGNDFSPDVCTFISHALAKNPERRLPAEVFLGAPWLSHCGATSLEKAVHNVYTWIRSR
eukprot:scaffold719_cov226-Pinguiococcus_pyrenoidosus.AAC.11